MQTIWLYIKSTWHKATDKEIETLENIAEKFKLGPWEYIYWKDRTAIKHAIMTKKVVAFGLYIQDGNWHNSGVICWDSAKQGNGGHLIAGYDWDDDQECWYIADWDGNGFKKLSYNYPLAFVAVADKGHDKDKDTNTMLRVIKKADSPNYYVVWADNTKSHIPSWELFKYGFSKGIWADNDKVEIVKDEDFDRIPTDESGERLLRIEKEFIDQMKS